MHRWVQLLHLADQNDFAFLSTGEFLFIYVTPTLYWMLLSP